MKAKKPFRGFAISIVVVAALTSFCHLKAPKAIAEPLTTAHQGEWILYLKENGSYAGSDGQGSSGNIWKVRPDGSGKTQLSHSGKCLSPIWVPDRRHIVFVSNNQVYIMGAEGKNVRRLTNLRGWECHSVNLSRDGKKIVFGAERFLPNDSSDAAIFVMDSNGANLHLILMPKDHDIDLEDPTFTSASNLMYVARGNKQEVGGDGLHSYSLSTKKSRCIYGSAYLNVSSKIFYKGAYNYYELYEPDLSPNRRQIATISWGYNTKPKGHSWPFDSDRIGIVVLNANGANAQMIYPLSKSLGDFWWPEGGPDWSPDGQKLVFPTSSGLTILDMTTKRSQVIVRGKNLSWPAW